jgi:phospholipase C
MNLETSRSPNVFISYSHDSAAHEDLVLRLANRLRDDGIEALIDQFDTAPRDGWPKWMDLEIQKADFVLVICTDVYLRRVENRETPGKGRGVLWESLLIYTHLYLSDAPGQRFIPILFRGGSLADIPVPLRAMTHYNIDTDDGYKDLYAHITNQPRHEMHRVGLIKSISPKQPQSYPSSLGFHGDGGLPGVLDQRNRSALIRRVRQDWISGVLGHSLYRVARIELGLVSKENAVEQPLRTQFLALGESIAPVEPDTTITRAFDDHGQALLILGAPGTGKTTLLLELTQVLLDRAECDQNLPVPVVFNLSSWAIRRQRFEEWLVTELSEHNDVPKKIARRWVESEFVLPLLDGLDEVASEYRRDCVDAINAFRRDHGLLPIVVSSRIADYESLGIRLRLRHAVLVETLTQTRVQDYLERGGEMLQPLRDAIATDAQLADLLQTPLMLWVAMLAYRNAPAQTAVAGTVTPQATQLFSSFVDAMFKRKGDARFSKEQTLSWLSWLAAAMTRKAQTIFYFESLGLDWLATSKERTFASIGIVTCCGLIVALMAWLGTTGILVGGGLGWGWWGVLILTALVFPSWLIAGLIASLTDLRPFQGLHFRFTGFRHRARKATRSGVLGGAFFGSLFSVIVAMFFWALNGSVLRPVLILGLPSFLLFGFFSWLMASITNTSIEAPQRPNQGPITSLKNALFVVPIGGAFVGLVCGLILGVAVYLADPFNSIGDFDIDDAIDLLEFSLSGVIVGALGGVFGGLFAGGLFGAKQRVLRFALWVTGSAPLKYSTFMDYAAERLLLHKVGGGYIFPHRSILMYFADLRVAGSTLPCSSEASFAKRRHKSLALTLAICLIIAGVYAFVSRNKPSDASENLQSLASSLEILKEAERKTMDRGPRNPNENDSTGLVPLTEPPNHVKHVVVLMLEKRSFDHMLGALRSIDPRVDGLTGLESNPDDTGNLVQAQPLAEIDGALNPGPDSSFGATMTQIFGTDRPSQAANMQNFVRNYMTRHQSREHARNVMYNFQLEKVSVLATLALEFAVCDRWFSSVPGSSFANHSFADYGSSFGKVKSIPFYFQEPIDSIYERLLNRGLRAKVYQYSSRTFILPLLILTKQHPQLFGTFKDFLDDAHSGNLPDYSFLEPDYGDTSADEANVARLGRNLVLKLSPEESFIAQVYNAIRRNESVWHSTVLLITYSDHGGFYDHVVPPKCTRDAFVASGKETGTGQGFDFGLLGVRVPTVIVSPYIPRGTVDHTQYDHASIPATITKLFLGIYARRSPREEHANTFDHVLSLKSPRPNSDTVMFSIGPGPEQ